MKQQLLQQYKDKLESDAMFAITVEDITDEENQFVVVCNKTNESLIRDYGSFNGFLETIYKEGARKVRITPRKRNGQSGGRINWKNATTIEVLEFELKPINVAHDQESKTQPQPAATAPAPVATPTYQAMPLMENPTGLTGMAAYRVFDYDRVNNELIQERTKREAAEAKVLELEKKVFENEILGTHKVQQTEAQAKLLETGSVYIPLIQEIFKGRNAAPTVPGLGQPVSEIKQLFMNQSDSLLQDLLPVAHGLQNQDFDSELQQLLTKYNLIQNG